MACLDKARVALLYSPGHLGVDFAGALFRGIERGLMELGATVASLNGVFGKEFVHPGDTEYDGNSALVQMFIEFFTKEARRGKFDLCLGLFHDQYLPAELQDCLRRTCRRIINYPLNLLDQAQRFERATEFCDETFCAEEEALAPLRARFGTNKIRYVPLASDPYIHRPIGSPASPRLLFVGSIYADRLSLLDLCAREMPTSIFGPNYNLTSVLRNLASEHIRGHRPLHPLSVLRMLGRVALRDRRIVGDEEYVRLAASHGVSIGFAGVRHERSREMLKKVRLRDYDATMCGLCHLAARLPELERGFDEGREILYYDDVAEIPGLLAKIRRDAIPWRDIGKNARIRAETEHTWTKRLGAALG
jgi:hypothetical protein